VRKRQRVADGKQVAVLVTGAAGLLGGALVRALTGAGHPVIGLVHREASIRDNGGNVLDAGPFNSASPPHGFMVLHGDVSQPGLGLDSAAQAWLDRHVSAIIHCAALVRFDAEWDALKAVNIAGTRHAAALCPDARFIHVSTAYVRGLRDGPIAEAPCDPDGPFGNLYEQSKAMGEAELHRLRPAATIARPSIIVGVQVHRRGEDRRRPGITGSDAELRADRPRGARDCGDAGGAGAGWPDRSPRRARGCSGDALSGPDRPGPGIAEPAHRHAAAA
jgi:nucleoside-diphosphate-sugar epimerase